jgi:hypothetical protein
MNIQHLPALVNRVSLVVVPILFALSGIAVPALKSGEVAQVALIAAHPTGWYLFTICSLLGSAALIPASIAMMQMTRLASPFCAIAGAGLLAVGGLVALSDSATQLVYWQMGTKGADPAQMAALIHRYENAAGASAIFMLGALAFVVGSVLVAAALVRAKAAPAWAAVLVPAGLVLNIASFVGSSRLLLIASSLVLLAGLGRVALGDALAPGRAAATASVQ